ncbi:MAG: hypothetical protein QXF56_04110 [Candidatus Micrarchaeia archaeon]
MDFRKIINASVLPIVVLVVLGVLTAIVTIALPSFLPMVGSILSILISLASFVLSCLVLGWAGYSAVKKHQLDLTGAAITGGIAAVVSEVINSVVALLLNLPGFMSIASDSAGGAVIGGGALLLFWFIGMIIGIAISAVLGVVLGAIGGYIAQRK